MKKYKLLKSIIMDGTEYKGTIEHKQDWIEQYGIDVEKLGEKYFEEIKEEETIQWKVGDKYCFEGHDYKTFGIIDRLRIEGGKYYMWGAGERWYLLDETRLAIPEEIQKYFN